MRYKRVVLESERTVYGEFVELPVGAIVLGKQDYKQSWLIECLVPAPTHEGLTLGDLKLFEQFRFPDGRLVYEVTKMQRLGVWHKELVSRRIWMHDAERKVVRV